MNKTTFSALAIVLPLTAALSPFAQAQSADLNAMNSGADSRVALMGSAGTVGAMNAAASGIATSADDVALQQAGRSTVADAVLRHADMEPAPVMGHSPGTVGAAPGANPVR